MTTTMLGFGVIAGAAAWLMGSILLFGSRIPGYSHRRMAISEMGSRGSRFESVIAYGVFMPVGVAALMVTPMLLFAREAAHVRVGAAALAACIGVAYFASAFCPVDEPGAAPSLRHQLHFAVAAVEYVGGPIALVVLGLGLDSPWPLSAAILAFLSAGACLLSVCAPWRGALQRTAESTLWGALLVIAGQLR